MPRNIKLLLSYDGTDFHGWQTQPGLRTVQETLEQAISAITGERVFANASGRTDTGVHALGQVVNFHTETRHSPHVLLRAINAHLPPDVVVREAEEVTLDFDACRHAKRKLYRYVIHDGAVADVFLRRYATHVPYRLNVEAMGDAARPLVGTHDFHSFETEWPNRQSSVRTITRLSIQRVAFHSSIPDLDPDPVPDPEMRRLLSGSGSGTGTGSGSETGSGTSGVIWIDVEADGFLYNMVRSIAGTLINVGRRYWPVSEVERILRAEDRRQAGPTAPAQGLFLVRVTYDDENGPQATST
jgi:tRNA pseudouridine38-40 synthase